jgi:hypothetical protein
MTRAFIYGFLMTVAVACSPRRVEARRREEKRR